jgi:ABC-type polysaccharide/polyol phosphate export permease
MGAYLAAVWRCRYFWLALVHMDLRNRYRGSVLGIGWSLLHPLAATLVICAVYSRLLKADVAEFVPFLLSGLACWTYMVSVVIQGCQCFVAAEAYIRQHALPLAIYPLRTTLGAIVHLLLALLVVLILAWGLRGLGNVLALASLIPAVLLLALWGWSVGLLAGFANTVFRDTHHILDIGLQLLFYLSAVIYPPRLLYDNGLGWWVVCNPLISLLNLIREPILAGRLPAAWDAGWATGMTLVLTASAILVLRRFGKVLIHYL